MPNEEITSAEVLSEVALALSIIADLVLFFYSLFESINLDVASTGIGTWRAIYSVCTALLLLWYLYFFVESRSWCLCHFNTYRMYIGGLFVSFIAMTVFVWLTDKVAVLSIYTPLYLLRLPLLAGLVRVWWLDHERRLCLRGHAASWQRYTAMGITAQRWSGLHTAGGRRQRDVAVRTVQ